ncbi:MAG TPA: polyribonucleotide nucleotidyltransferase, partial [Hyphomonadaceae bacterium]|nr:polyribonucleotide nucleotidyltransferase [Hyphomonadaceae bacterium]
AAYKIKDKAERQAAVGEARAKAAEALVATEEKEGMDALIFKDVFKKAEAKVVRGDIIKTGVRIDGRALDQVRPIVSEV